MVFGIESTLNNSVGVAFFHAIVPITGFCSFSFFFATTSDTCSACVCVCVCVMFAMNRLLSIRISSGLVAATGEFHLQNYFRI